MKITRYLSFPILATGLVLIACTLFLDLIGVDITSFFFIVISFLNRITPILVGIFIIYFGMHYLQTRTSQNNQLSFDQQANQSILKIAVRSGEKILLLSLDKIASFYARHNYVYAYTDEGKEYLVEHTLAELENKLPRNFVRVHRSTIINEDFVQSIEKEKGGKHIITLDDQKNKKIHVSQSYGKVVRKMTAL